MYTMAAPRPSPVLDRFKARIEYEIKYGREVRAVVCLSIESDLKGFRQPDKTEEADFVFSRNGWPVWIRN